MTMNRKKDRVDIHSKFTFRCFQILLTFSAFLICAAVHAAGKRTELLQDLQPGVRIYRYDWDVEQCSLYVAEIDRSNEKLHFEVAIAGDQILGKETVRSMAHRRAQRGDRRVVVAVNGGFGVLGDMRGYGGVLENLHIQDGELMTQPTDQEACFGVTEAGEFLIGPVELKANITIGDGVFPVECINQRRLDGCNTILYTPRLGYSTHTKRRGLELILSDLKLPVGGSYASEFVVAGIQTEGNNPIPKDGAVLSFRSRVEKTFISQFSEGQRGKIELALHPPAWNDVVHAIGGRLRLVKNGEVNETLAQLHRDEKKHTPGKRTPILPLSHEPRTAFGYNDQKLLLIVADGRQPDYSTGLSLYELATILTELGATEAINLDGGSSSTFIVDGEVINRPSGQEEREVLNAVFITVDNGS
jgi:hypothetical protein